MQDPAVQDEVLANRIERFGRLIEPALTKRMGMLETIRDADNKGLKIIPNREIELYLSNGRRPSGATGKVWTGTLLIFEECGRHFRDKIEFSIGMFEPEMIVFDVPKRYQGQIGCLTCEHPDFRLSEISDKKYTIYVPESRLHLLSRFPVSEGLYLCDEFFRLPEGDTARKNGVGQKKTYYLSISPSAFIGLLARDFENMKNMHSTDWADDEMSSLVRVSMTPNNYISHIIAMMNDGASPRMRKFISEWLAEDKCLRNGLKKAGIGLD